MTLLRIMCLALLGLCLPIAASADYVEIRRNAYVYAQAARTSPPLDHIDLETVTGPVYLEIADPLTVENGYIRVRRSDGLGQGWIYKSLVRAYAGVLPAVDASAREFIPAGAAAVGADVMVAHFIDVGQGDAALLEFSCGAILIDAGGEMTNEVDGPARLISYLEEFFERRQDLGNTLDLVALTHPHIDHTRAIPDVLEAFTIRSAIDNGMDSGSGRGQQRRLQTAAANDDTISYQAIRLENIDRSDGLTNDVIDTVDCDGTDPVVTALWGSLDEDPGWSSGGFDNPNNHSVVLRVDFGDASFLFTGDLQEPAIEDLVGRYDGSDTLDVDVYQVGHHGSHNGTTEDLMRAMSPALALLSVGNPEQSRATFSAYSFAHPRSDAVEHLEDPAYGVSHSRAQPALVPVGQRGACRSCSPARPPIFEQWTVDQAIYATGWDGTVRITARSDGRLMAGSE